MPGEAAISRTRSSDLFRRIAVTLGAVALVAVGERIALPGVDVGAYRHWRAMGYSSLSVAQGLWAFVAGFLLVESVALVVPRLRPLRHGSAADRRVLARAAWGIALVFAAWYGWALAVTLQGELADARGNPMLDAGLAPALGVAGTIAFGVVAMGGAAELVSRFGIGNGFAVLFAASATERLVWLVRAMLAQPRGMWTDSSLLVGLALLVVIPLVAARLRRASQDALAGPRVPLPTCGLVPLSGTTAVFAFPARLGAWLPAALPLAAALARDSWLLGFAALALTMILAGAFAALFSPPGAVVDAYRRAAGGQLDGETAATVRAVAGMASRRSMALLAGLALVPIAGALLGSAVEVSTGDLFDIAVISAVAFDLIDEARARAGGGALVSARPIHRMYAVAPALDALGAAGIPAFAKTRRFRTLFHFFAPYAPVEILVAPEHAAEADAVCARVTGGSIPGRR